MVDQGLVFSDEQLASIEECLGELLGKSKALAVLFASEEGQPVGQLGRLTDKDKMALSTLAAGSFAATVAMARLLGQKGRFEHLFFEGEDQGVYSSAVGEGFLLTIAFDGKAKPGLVRLLSQEAAKKLLDILREARVQQLQQPVEDLLDAEFGESLADQLDALFSEEGNGVAES
jgi:predicted regulator of Ras-like GTPase activity (Roadblock/LC7/MglB family)